MTALKRVIRVIKPVLAARCAGTVAIALAVSLAEPADARDASEVFARGFGSKAAAMGNSFVSIADDASAVFWNPAGAGWMPRKTFTFSLTDMYFADVEYSSASYVHPLDGAGALGVSLSRWSVDGIEKRDENNLLLENDLSDIQMELIASYSLPPIHNTTAALGVKMDTQSLDGETAAGIGLDMGLLYRRGSVQTQAKRVFNAGISVRNVVEPVLKLRSDRTKFPTRAVFATSYGGATSYLDKWMVTLDLNAPSDLHGTANLGFEASIRPVSLRIGSMDGKLTAGIGTAWEGLSFDYAYADEDFGRLHTFSLSISFGNTAPHLVSGPEKDDAGGELARR